MVPTLKSAFLSAASPSFFDPRVLQASGLLVAGLLAAALILALVDRWRKRQTNAVSNAHDELSRYRLLYQQGELSKEEFERIRNQVAGRMKSALQPATADATREAAADPTEKATPPLASDLPPDFGSPSEFGRQNPQG